MSQILLLYASTIHHPFLFVIRIKPQVTSDLFEANIFERGLSYFKSFPIRNPVKSPNIAILCKNNKNLQVIHLNPILLMLLIGESKQIEFNISEWIVVVIEEKFYCNFQFKFYILVIALFFHLSLLTFFGMNFES